MIHIVTDTSADITVAQAQEMGVELVPLEIHFGEKPYYPLQDDSFSIFYEMLEGSKELPTTSQPAPAGYLSIYKQAREAGDDVIVITISGHISGTVQSANLAKDMAKYDRIYVIDSLSAIMGQRLLVEMAVKMRDEGKSAPEIAEALKDAADRIVLIAGLDTLKYLRKGGRIPKSAEMLGNIIGIKPMVELVEGKIVAIGKGRGVQRMMNLCVDAIRERPAIDESMPVYFGYTQREEHGRAFQELVEKELGLQDTVFYPIGSVVGTHVGPGAFAIVYLGKEKRA